MVVFTAVVTISTVVYAILTGVLVKETRRLREAQTEPKIEILLKPREEFINIVQLFVRNIGLGPAYNIGFATKVLAGGEGAEELINDLTKNNFFVTGLKYLGPGQQVRSHYSQMTKNFEAKIQSVLEFSVNYQSASRRHYSEQFCIDMGEFKGLTQLGTPHLSAISKNIEAIKNDIHHLLTGFRRIKADIFTAKDRKREEKEHEEFLREAMGKEDSSDS